MSDIFTLTPDEGDGDEPTPQKKRKRRRSKPVIALITLASVLVGVLVVVGVVGGVYASRLANSFNDNATKIEQAFPEESTRPAPAPDGAMNILLMGSDSRADATTIDDASSSDQRTDSMMLVHVDADRENVYVMSIMRDLYVPIPGHGSNKINAAFAYGGSPLTVQTVEQLLGVRIDHVAIIDFEGFKGMTTALGGVDVFSPQAFSTKTGFSYPAGLNKLEGDAALAFVRERYAFADADFTRVKNQQAFVKGLANTILSRSTLTDPGKISSFVTAMSPYLTVDKEFDVGTIASLGFSLRAIDGSKMHFFTIPTAGTGSIGGQSIVNIDQVGLDAVKVGLAGDTLETFPAAQ
ncbi:LCP family protein [Frigoribacterium sp. R86507]|uniref:LCP family protein n=1 Tax=Frigoribacterium sp. R86507 TaxID=3093850 RepID=UPI0037C8B4FB